MGKLLDISRLQPVAGHRVPRSVSLAAVRPSRANELLYLSRLTPIVRDLQGLGDKIIADLRSAWIGRDAVLFDAGERRGPKATVNKARAEYGHINGGPTAEIVVNAAANTVDATIAVRVHNALGVDVSGYLLDRRDLAHAMAAARRANVELITSIPDRYFDQIDDAIEAHWLEGARWETLSARIQEIGGITERRADLIAQDQTSKLNAAFNAIRQPSLGIEQYEWSTAHDERVRVAHRAMDGTVHYWGHPPLVDGEPANPGEPVRCRCVALPRIVFGAAAAGAAYAEAA